MKSCFILNPIAGSFDGHDRLRERLEAIDDARVELTREEGHARRLARRAAEDGCRLVVAGGGDGTLHEVLDGLSDHLDTCVFGVLPLGTGNDFARALGMPLDPDRALDVLLEANRMRLLDLVEIVGADGRTSLALNHVNGGYADLISAEIDAETKQRLGPWAYLKGATTPLGEMQQYETKIVWPDGSVEVVDAIDIILANGRTVAGGFSVAPDASLEDGVFETVIVHAGSLMNLAGIAARLAVGRDPEHSEQVTRRAATTIHLESDPPMVFSIDGERFCESGIDARVLPKALRAIVGPDYVVAP